MNKQTKVFIYGMLSLFFSFLLFFNSLLQAQVHDDCSSLDPSFPKDIARFKQRRCLCYHFYSEPPYSEDRREFLKRKVKETCGGLKELRDSLRERYKNDKKLLEELKELDASVYQMK